MKVKEQEEELDEQAGTIQQLEQAKLKLEMQNSKTSIQHQKDLDSKEEELEQSRFATQKRIKTLELQLEDEHEEKSTLLRDKRNLEKQLRELAEQTPKRDRGVEKRLRQNLKRSRALLSDAQLTLEKQPDVGGANLKSLKVNSMIRGTLNG
jgi:myosin-18